MVQTRLAFLWHQHQPVYRDALTGAYTMPWVRLHAIGAYIGMPLILREFPEVKATINLVPCLIRQIQDYAAGRAEDALLRVTRIPAADLSAADRQWLLHNGFPGDAARLIRPQPRYAELYDKCRRLRAADRGMDGFTDEEVRDLQVWSTLAWFHPILAETDPVLRVLTAKGRDFSEDDKAVMLRKQSEAIGRVIPLHRELLEAGQIEISTTPFYHPILPLLVDMEVARTHGHKMPAVRADLSEDARTQVRRAVEWHREVFGTQPAGMWPAEGAVCEEMLSVLAEFGASWIVTDSEILARSTDAPEDAAKRGDSEFGAHLCQPWLPPGDRAGPVLFFRDHELSDAVGFAYHKRAPDEAAADFVARVTAAGERSGLPSPVASVALDGENPWENYANGGLDFLRAVYGAIQSNEAIRTTTFSEYLSEQHPAPRLSRLFPGSWIAHDFALWIGSAEDRLAWEYLARVRRDLVSAIGPPRWDEPNDAHRRAWEQIYIAEGSDWFWWYGEERSSGQDAEFDALFRAHLAAAYECLGRSAPGFLARSIPRSRGRPHGTGPRWLLDVTVDGRATHYFEWEGAGRYNTGCAGCAAGRLLREVHFGFDAQTFFLRVDAAGAFRDVVPAEGRFRVCFSGPREIALETGAVAADQPKFEVRDAAGNRVVTRGSLAFGEVMELACPLADLAAEPEAAMEFYVALLLEDEVIERVPEQGAISVVAPPSNFEKVMWQV